MRTDSKSVSASLDYDQLAESLRTVLQPLVDELTEARSVPILKPLLTKRDVADYLSVNVRTIDLLVSEGELIPIRVRSVRRFSQDAVERYLRSQTHQIHPRLIRKPDERKNAPGSNGSSLGRGDE